MKEGNRAIKKKRHENETLSKVSESTIIEGREKTK